MLPFAVKNIDHIVFRVADLDQAVGFYESALGCTVVKRRDDLGLVHLRAGTSMIDLISICGKLGSVGGTAPGTEGRNTDHLCLRIEPFDEVSIREQLAKHGRGNLGPVVSNFGAEGTGPSLYVTDLDGNAIELKGPARPQTGDA